MDSCPSGENNWISISTDHDGDGCKDDSTEDLDDDNDGISDDIDTCNLGDLFTSNPVQTMMAMDVKMIRKIMMMISSV